MSGFKNINLIPSIEEALDKKGYKEPTPIQAQAIPFLLNGSDLLGIAQTGTGKTAAFSLPILNRFGLNPIKLKSKQVRCLILTPTRELASQIEMNIKEYGQGMKPSTRVVFGGVGKQPQISAIRGGLDFLVATPGRLLDLMSEGHIDYSALEVFVLDEADTMLDMGFFNDVKKIISKLPKKRQTLLFSATMPKDIAKLASSILMDPVRVEVAPESTTVEKIDQRVYHVEKANKMYLLLKLMENSDIKSVLVFSKTKYNADRIVTKLEKGGFNAVAIHSKKSQGAREKSLEAFRSGKARILVATDIAARGIDVSHVTHVINFNLPEDPKSYVHRIGRTARAGRMGSAISFVEAVELSLLRNVEKSIKIKIPLDADQPFHAELDESNIPAPAPRGARKKPANNNSRDSRSGGNSGKRRRPASKKVQSRRRR